MHSLAYECGKYGQHLVGNVDALAWGTFTAAFLAVIVPIILFLAGRQEQRKRHEELLNRLPMPLLSVEYEPVVPKVESRGYGETAEYRIKHLEIRASMENPGSQYAVEIMKVEFRLLWSRPEAQRQEWVQDLTPFMPLHEGRWVIQPRHRGTRKFPLDPDLETRRRLQALPSATWIDAQITVILLDGRIVKGPVVHAIQGRKPDQQWLWRHEILDLG